MSKSKKVYCNSHGDEMYNQERNNQIADGLESYVDAIDSLCVLEGRSADEVNKAIKTIRKACKNLRNGHPEKVFDEERFYANLYSESDE